MAEPLAPLDFSNAFNSLTNFSIRGIAGTLRPAKIVAATRAQAEPTLQAISETSCLPERVG